MKYFLSPTRIKKNLWFLYTIILWVLFFTIHTLKVLLAVFLREAVNDFVQDRVEYENVLNGCLKFVCGFFTLFHHFESILGGIKTRLKNILALQAAAEEFSLIGLLVLK